jgi:hypothetical protein
VVNKNFIEINGKKYDATTGRLITDEPHKIPKAPSKQAHVAPAAPISGPKVVDGFMRPKPSHSHPAAHQPKHIEHHKPHKSKTLMRKSVAKPEVPAKVITHKNPLNIPDTTNEPEGLMLSRPDSKRNARAESTKKNGLISRFGFSSKKNLKHSSTHKTIGASEPKHDQQVAKHPNVIKKDDMVHKAISRSEHHQKVAHGHKHRTPIRHRVAKKVGVSNRVANIAAASLVIVLVIGFVAYQNVPNLNMRIASTRAGFNASLPGYKPSGFSMAKNIEATPGQVVISFKSNSDDRSFKIIEKTSNWNSEVLLEKYITQNEVVYQTFQDKGKTIYIYDGSNATWVDAGVWYRVEGSSSLTNDQLLDIASSI